MRRALKTMVGASLAWGLAVQPATAAVPAPPMAVAVSKWQVDFGDEQCVAMRQFTAGGRTFLFGIEPNPQNDGGRLIFRIDKDKPRPEIGWFDAKLFFDGQKISDTLSVWPGAKDGLLISAFYGKGGKTDEARHTDIISTKVVAVQWNRFSAAVPLSQMDKLAPMLADCNAGLLASWGFSRADQQRVKTKSQGSIVMAFSESDYPSAAIRGEQQGEVSVRYKIDAQGKIQNCVVRRTSGFPLLDGATCSVLNQRGRMVPAKDAAGKPIATVEVGRIRWVLPD